MQLVRTPTWTLERDVGDAYFRMRRLPGAVPSMEALKQHAAAIEQALTKFDTSRLGLLFDVREGPLRNDPEFESAARPYQEKLMRGFRRVAILVKTPVGKLQVGRIIRTIGANAQVFDDERAAIDYVKQQSPPAP